jgi:hypothetical protein
MPEPNGRNRPHVFTFDPPSDGPQAIGLLLSEIGLHRIVEPDHRADKVLQKGGILIVTDQTLAAFIASTGLFRHR